MMDAKDAWNSFFSSGSVLDYLHYRAILHANNGDDLPKDNNSDEVQDQGTDTPTTEYR